MASLTPAEITAIAEPLELIYQNMTDELLVNIARHLKGGWDDTATWEMKKLGQLGALTQESAQIIAKYTGQTEQEITKAFLEAASLATADIDPVLAQAAADGKLIDPGTTVATSQSMQAALRSYVEQATDKLNMTNTTMLASTQQVYANTVHTAAMTAQLEQAKAIIETQAGAVITGRTARTKAMQTALNQMNAAGIAGFYDRIGRKWSPEAYVNMVVKTTAHNAAIQSIRTRQAEYGAGDIFQVSQHPGARPLCYPYQGKFYSWSGFGVWTDGAGKQHVYENINDATSYGQPAGLFGINCGHHPIPMVDGYSFPQDQEEQTPEENAKEYEESQKQRALEREIRAAKREQEVLKAAGDDEGAKAAGAKVRMVQARMRQFIEDTGRVRRYDRESIGGGTTPTLPKVGAPRVTTPTPAPVAPTTTKFANVQGLPDDNKRAMAEALANAPNETAKKVYTKYADELVAVETDKKSGAFFKCWGGQPGIHFNAANDLKGNSYENPNEVAFHEFGHMIDWLAGGKDNWNYLSQQGYNGQSLVDTILSDYKAFKKSLKPYGITTNDGVIEFLFNEHMSAREYGNISDILEKCTNKSYPLGIGHGVKYHKREGSTEKEFFTEVLSSAVVNQPSYNQMVRIFPNAVDMVWKMLEDALQ